MKKPLLGLVSVVFALAVTSAFATPMTPITNIVNNSGFETGNFTGWNNGGNTGVDMSSAYSGTYGANIELTEGVSTVSQNLNTTAGSLYDFSFFLAAFIPKSSSHTNALGGFGSTFQVFWNGMLVLNLVNPDPFEYTQFSYTNLAATSSTTNITFAYSFGSGDFVEGGPNNLIFNLDDVVVGAVGVPESLSSLWLMLPVTGMFVATRRQRRTA